MVAFLSLLGLLASCETLKESNLGRILRSDCEMDQSGTGRFSWHCAGATKSERPSGT